MSLELIKRPPSANWYLRGSVRGLHVFESTRTSDDEAAETIRIIRERELVDESIFGKKVSATFEKAAEAYLAGGGSARFLAKLTDVLGTKLLKNITQNDLDAVARKLHPDAAPETRNRQCYTPFIGPTSANGGAPARQRVRVSERRRRVAATGRWIMIAPPCS
jgi:integrase/recombinase XerD